MIASMDATRTTAAQGPSADDKCGRGMIAVLSEPFPQLTQKWLVTVSGISGTLARASLNYRNAR